MKEEQTYVLFYEYRQPVLNSAWHGGFALELAAMRFGMKNMKETEVEEDEKKNKELKSEDEETGGGEIVKKVCGLYFDYVSNKDYVASNDNDEKVKLSLPTP
jgi:hypothetical protein